MKLIKKLGRRPNKTGPNKSYWGLFECPICGKEVEKRLCKGTKALSCGCVSGKLRNRNRLLDLTNKRFGRLVVVRKTNKMSGNNRVWECLCDCGETTHVAASNLQQGWTTSCGCFHKERISQVFKEYHTIHGESRSYLYGRWSSLFERCGKHRNYLNVSVCNEWKGPQGYLNFKKWITDQGYDEESLKGMHIHRKNNGDYGPDECEIISAEEHGRIHGKGIWTKQAA